MACWNPCLYSCSSAGTIDCLRFHLEASSLSSACGAGSRHSGRNTMKDRGSRESASRRSKCTIVASRSSSENGGFASNEPHWGLKSRIGLKSENCHIKGVINSIGVNSNMILISV